MASNDGAMKTRHILALSLFLAVFLLLGLSLSGKASPAPQLQQYATPTPGPDGRIIYIVQEGDNCISIALKSGITLEQLRAFNSKLDENCTNLQVEQELLLGLGGPAAYTPTAGPSPTPAPPTVTPTPFTGTTEVCALLFDDVNGDALRQTTEIGIAGGAVSLSNTAGTYSQTQDTVSTLDADTGEPVLTCFTDVPEGEYNVSMAIPDGYNATMTLNYTIQVKAGDRAFVDFGAQSQAAAATTASNQDGSQSPLLGIVGALMLLGGVGLGWYAWRMRQPRGKLRLNKSLLKK